MADQHQQSHEWTSEPDRACKRSLASTQRGIGPARQCSEVPVTEIAASNLSVQPLTEGGPICPSEWAIINSFHLTRGGESACALGASVTMNPERKSYDWLLPVSKTDPQAVGCTRSWGCVCVGATTGPCPYCAMVRLQAELLRKFGVNGQLPADLPLFPDTLVQWVSREAFVETITSMADKI